MKPIIIALKTVAQLSIKMKREAMRLKEAHRRAGEAAIEPDSYRRGRSKGAQKSEPRAS